MYINDLNSFSLLNHEHQLVADRDEAAHLRFRLLGSAVSASIEASQSGIVPFNRRKLRSILESGIQRKRSATARR